VNLSTEYAVVKSLFSELLSRTIEKMCGEKRLALPEDFEKVKTILTERVEAWRKQLKGEDQLEGTAKTLLHLLSKKFGPTLPAEISSTVHTADEDLLKLWTDRILDATTLEDVFQHGRP
jgi:hypothetical protein